MQPTLRTKTQGGGPGLTVILICFIVAGAVTLGAWSYWNKKYKVPADERRKAAAAATKTNTTTTPTVAANAKTNHNPIARAANTLNKVAAQNQDGEKTADAIQAGATKTAPVAVAPATPPKVQPVTPPAAAPTVTAAPSTVKLPKLQGIFFRAKDATAILDGVTVKVGDEVHGAKVTGIKRTSVTIQMADGAHDLMMK